VGASKATGVVAVETSVVEADSAAEAVEVASVDEVTSAETVVAVAEATPV
jgi:hypothetical protein